MKKIFTILFLLITFIANAQRTMFTRNNNYVRLVPPPVTTGTNPVTNGLILYLDATRTASCYSLCYTHATTIVKIRFFCFFSSLLDSLIVGV